MCVKVKFWADVKSAEKKMVQQVRHPVRVEKESLIIKIGKL